MEQDRDSSRVRVSFREQGSIFAKVSAAQTRIQIEEKIENIHSLKLLTLWKNYLEAIVHSIFNRVVPAKKWF